MNRPRLLWLPLAALVLVGCPGSSNMADDSPVDTTVTGITNSVDAAGRRAGLLSAFFGLDDALPQMADRAVCDGAGGKDGMPVIFSQEVDVSTLQAGDLKVVTESGAVGEITCVTLAPADDPGEARTALLVGAYGSAEDQPVSVEVIGNVLSKDGQLNFRGAVVDVIELEAGPTLVLAEDVPEQEWALGKRATRAPLGGGSGCPKGTAQVIRAVWAGGITKPGNDEVDDNERLRYRVTLRDVNGDIRSVVPFALGDLGDGDNNHELCLDVRGAPLEVVFEDGYVTDPRDDLNPLTRVSVSAGN
ncbi:MAG: hypothetical protein AAFS02_06625 [Pseudomonadota bacterium]